MSRHFPLCLLPLLGCLGIFPAFRATAQPHAVEAPCEFEPGEERPAWLTPWSDAFPEVVVDLARGEPLVALVVVPLCSNDQIECGSNAAGRPGDLSTNLYWGAGFGVAKFFDRELSPWDLVELSNPGSGVLEQRIYRRPVPLEAWRSSFQRLRGECAGAEPASLEQYVVFRAVHGNHIDQAVLDFWRGSTEGARVSLPFSEEQSREARVHVVGYAGHNRLIDGLELPTIDASRARAPRAPASFVLACYSEDYFAASLRDAGSAPLVMTRALMAPEGYIVDALLRSLGENDTSPMLRQRVVRAYSKWQQIPEETASLIFSR